MFWSCSLSVAQHISSAHNQCRCTCDAASLGAVSGFSYHPSHLNALSSCMCSVVPLYLHYYCLNYNRIKVDETESTYSPEYLTKGFGKWNQSSHVAVMSLIVINILFDPAKFSLLVVVNVCTGERGLSILGEYCTLSVTFNAFTHMTVSLNQDMFALCWINLFNYMRPDSAYQESNLITELYLDWGFFSVKCVAYLL